jgi:hypothetical protein
VTDLIRGGFYQALSCALSAALLTAPILQAQDGGLRVVVLRGEEGVNNIDQRIVVEPIVEVQDAEGKPVPKALVTFRSPAVGPSVTFFGASRSSTISTDDAGRAQATGMLPNTEPGAFHIDVEAAAQGMSASAQIAQSNVAAAETKQEKKLDWRWWVAIGAGVAIAITAAVLDGDSGPAAAPQTDGVAPPGVVLVPK